MPEEIINEKFQRDLISLIKVLDECMDEIENIHERAIKDRMLASSCDN
jgi:hypothetical protein